MKKPDSARFMGKQKMKADTLEMKGFSSSPLDKSPASTEKKSINKKPSESTKERVSERSDERTGGKEKIRLKTRHAFDIFEDQLRSLHQIQLQAVQAGKKKPKLGDMVQDALDEYLNEKGIERTDERPNVRTDEQI